MASPLQVYDTIHDIDTKKLATDISYARTTYPSPCFLSYHPSFTALLGSSPSLELIEHRPSDTFAHEAGVYIPSTNSNYFTSTPQNGSISLYSVNHATNKVSSITFPDVVNANGACHYANSILFCSQGDRTTPSALVLADPVAGTSQVLLNNFHGREFNSINDVAVHHPSGAVWFTDPLYGYMQDFRPAPQLPVQVYRFVPETGEVCCVADGFAQCNGLCFSPDYMRCYITDTGAVQAHAGPGGPDAFSVRPGFPATVYVFDVVDGGRRLANRRVFAYCDNGIPDGIKCDERGNVYSGCGDGVHVWDEHGTLLGKIWVGSVVPNFNFARDGMWLLAHEKLFFCRLGVKGALAEVEGH